jgi:hypothetical protein
LREGRNLALLCVGADAIEIDQIMGARIEASPALRPFWYFDDSVAQLPDFCVWYRFRFAVFGVMHGGFRLERSGGFQQGSSLR